MKPTFEVTADFKKGLEEAAEKLTDPEQKEFVKDALKNATVVPEPDNYTKALESKIMEIYKLVPPGKWIEEYLKEKLPKEVISGRKHLEGGEKGRKTRGMLDDKTAMDMCIKLYKERPDLRMGAIRKEAGRRLGFKLRCIEEHTRGLQQAITELKK